eukprot:266080_1
MEVVPLSDDAANPVGDLNGENANVAISEMQQQVETAPLLNAESLGEVLRDVPDFTMSGSPNAIDSIQPDDIMLGLKNLSLCTSNPPEKIISDVSGFVIKGESLLLWEHQILEKVYY